MKTMTKQMNRSVLDIYADDSVDNVNSSTLKALRDRSLLGIDDRLTDLGKRYALSRMPLAKQCSELSLQYDTVALPYDGTPEAALLDHYNSLGYIGISSEGMGILTVLKALMLDKLAHYNPFRDRGDACTRYLEAQLAILEDNADELILSMSSVSKRRYVSNFEELLSKSSIASECPELSTEFALAMYDAIDIDLYIAIARKIAEDPYTYRAGWPDLTLVKGDDVLSIEVKTTDTLHDSQLLTIPVMRHILPFPFRVSRITR